MMRFYRRLSVFPALFALCAIAVNGHAQTDAASSDAAIVAKPKPVVSHLSSAPFGRPKLAGLMTDLRLVELSGLAPARYKERFWGINDGGQAAILWLIDGAGNIMDQMPMAGVSNIDFEDLAALTYRGKNYIAVGDIGDNAATAPEHTIYVMPEPDALNAATRKGVAPAWTVRYRYPDGPHDAESLMADVRGGYFYIVNKRVSPPILYRVPMKPPRKNRSMLHTAERIGAMMGLPEADANSPDQRNQVRFASQPTGAVLGCDANELLLLTYAALYRYQKLPNVPWSAALISQQPQALALPPMFQAEAVTLSKDCQTLYVAGEKVPSPLWRFSRKKQ
jgi:hypothetical protein